MFINLILTSNNLPDYNQDQQENILLKKKIFKTKNRGDYKHEQT